MEKAAQKTIYVDAGCSKQAEFSEGEFNEGGFVEGVQ